jgi:hypothetical protein
MLSVPQFMHVLAIGFWPALWKRIHNYLGDLVSRSSQTVSNNVNIHLGIARESEAGEGERDDCSLGVSGSPDAMEVDVVHEPEIVGMGDDMVGSPHGTSRSASQGSGNEGVMEGSREDQQASGCPPIECTLHT